MKTHLRPITFKQTMGINPLQTSRSSTNGIWMNPTACATRKSRIATRIWQRRKNSGISVVFNTHLLL